MRLLMWFLFGRLSCAWFGHRPHDMGWLHVPQVSGECKDYMRRICAHCKEPLPDVYWSTFRPPKMQQP